MGGLVVVVVGAVVAGGEVTGGMVEVGVVGVRSRIARQATQISPNERPETGPPGRNSVTFTDAVAVEELVRQVMAGVQSGDADV